MSVFHQNILAGASGAAGGASALYVDDVFSTFLYEGNGSSSRDIVNGIDLSGEGGLSWIKSRTLAESNNLYDTERGASKAIFTNGIAAQANYTSRHKAFNSDGFRIGSDDAVNKSSNDYVSWTFRKAPGFFDVVTYTGNGTAGRTVSHNLGSTPGMIVIKKTSNSENWIVYHRSVGATKFLTMNGAMNASTSSVIFNDTEPTSTEFTLGLNSQVNESGDTYVAYVFAHDDQSFGTDSDEAIIKCDKYTGNATAGKQVSLGFEPQWLMIKKIDGSNTGRWFIVDMMRGIGDAASQTAYLAANLSSAEAQTTAFVANADGFRIDSTGAESNQSGTNYAYIAIRRPHKPPTAGTDVFTADAAGLNPGVSNSLLFEADHVVDLCINRHRTNSSANHFVFDRLRGNGRRMYANGTTYETSMTNFGFLDFQKGVGSGSTTGNGINHCAWMFRRAPGFFDIVAYSGTGADQVVNHGLGVTPELMILKARTTLTAWRVFYKDGSTEKNLQLSSTVAAGNIPASHPWSPSATTFRADGYFSLSNSGHDYIAYAFATLAGISKVGLYSGTGSDVDVDCGFSAGARFVLIKRTDSSGDWYAWDTARGIVAGNDPYLRWNVTVGAEVTNNDYIDPLNSGFTVTSSAPAALNTSGGSYLFLAIA